MFHVSHSVQYTPWNIQIGSLCFVMFNPPVNRYELFIYTHGYCYYVDPARLSLTNEWKFDD